MLLPIPYPTGYDGHGADGHFQMIRQTREKIWSYMTDKAGVRNLGVVDRAHKKQMMQTATLISQFIDFKADTGKPDVQRMVMDLKLESEFIRRGKRNYQWVSASQGEERFVAFIWPRPLFDMEVQFYATSELFIDRINMIMNINRDILIDE